MKSYDIKESYCEFIKHVVAALNSGDREFKLLNSSIEEINLLLSKYIYPSFKDYWFKYIDKNTYIISIRQEKKEYYFKEYNEYGFSCKRYIHNENFELTLADDETIKELSQRDYINFLCKVIFKDDILEEKKINSISDLIFFIKKNLANFNQYDEKLIDKLLNIANLVVDEAVDSENFYVEFNIYENRVKFMYFLCNDLNILKKDKIIILEDRPILGIILRILDINFEDISNPRNTKKIRKLDLLLESVKTPKTAKELMDILGLKDRETFYNNYLKPAIKKGYIQYTIPDKPRSPKQKYVIVKIND